jgi:hypothetical protein
MTTAKCRAQGGPVNCTDPDCPQRIAFYATLGAEPTLHPATSVGTKRAWVPWEARFQELQAWVSSHGSMPKLTSTDASERRLGVWINNQKGAMRGTLAAQPLTEHQQALMAELDPNWLAPQRNRTRQLDMQMLQDFIATQGRVPRYDAADREERALYAWASKQRTHGDSVTKTAINRLMPAKTAGRKGGASMQQLRDFVATTGRSPRNSAPAGSVESALHTWVSNQRRVNPNPAVVAELNRLAPKHSRGEDIFADYPED